MWYIQSSRGLIWPFFLKTNVTGAVYKSMMQGNIISSIILIFGGKLLKFDDGTPPHYHNEVRNFTNVHFPARWTWHFF